MANAYYAYYAFQFATKQRQCFWNAFVPVKEVDIGPIMLVPYLPNDLVLLLFSTLLFPSLC